MKRVRLSVLGLMAIIVVIALALAALRNPTALWSSLTFMATIAALATAVLGAISRRGRARMTWAGLATFGWAYVLVSFGPIPNGNGVTCPPMPTQAVVEWLRTSREAAFAAQFRATKAVAALATDSPPDPEPFSRGRILVPKVLGFGTVIQGLPGGDQMVQADGRLKTIGFAHPYFVAPATVPFAGPAFDWKDHRRVCHSLGTLLFGLVGAGVGRALAGRDESGAEPA